ncbi:MAG: helix-turn-helix domain-containing protein [Elusimicrobia bacterium]|nr:helix-turn-helix domain-containing protein [Elusimicrobiota bacterium]
MADENPERTFTTFEVARLCGVFYTTVAHWIDNGKLKAYTTPGKHHRIVCSELIAFMRAYEMPIPPDLAPEPRRILIIDDDRSRGCSNAPGTTTATATRSWRSTTPSKGSSRSGGTSRTS